MSHTRARSDSGPGLASWTFVVVAVVLAAAFVRLGVWQLDRLGERRAANRQIQASMDLPAEDLATAVRAGAPAGRLSWHRIRATGTWDLDHEIVIRGRAKHGSPGVHVVTPLVFAPDSAVLVLRGWLPAADGLSADLASALPAAGNGEVEGLARAGELPSQIPPRLRSFAGAERLVLGNVVIDQAAEWVPHHLLPVFILASGAQATPGSPIALPEPALSDGPHLWYAVQWFSFATISLIGAFVYIRTRRRSASSEGGRA